MTMCYTGRSITVLSGEKQWSWGSYIENDARYGYSRTIQVQGHGRLLEPPSRSSMWRFGYDTPSN
ncbi:unnamed protein product, partial [Larinioides sclopetarius]